MGVKGYKVFNPDWTCCGFEYEVGKTYTHIGEIEPCKAGFHFCTKAIDCFKYYEFNNFNKVAEVEAIGRIRTDGGKSVTDKLVIVKEIEWSQLLKIVNTGDDCTGLGNTGDRNEGWHNTGNENTGNWNAGNWNEGDWNTGNSNTGSCNTGCVNIGNRNTGDKNDGSYNTGRYNTGSRNTGDFNGGGYNTGKFNTGCFNTGCFNTGDYNTGDYNIGNYNVGDWNRVSYSTGFFNTESQPVYMFNKPTDMSKDDIRSLEGMKVLVRKYKAFRQLHPKYGINRFINIENFKTVCKAFWETVTPEERDAVMNLPNFDADIFEEITGIKV